jgi:molecular chaperone DnaK
VPAGAGTGNYAVGTASIGATPVRSAPGGSVYGGAPPGPPVAPGSGFGSRYGNRMPMIAVAAAVLLVLVGGGVALALTLNNGNETPQGQNSSTPAASEAAPTTEPAAPVIPPDEQCTDAIKANPRWVCLTKATMTANELRIEYEFEDNGTPFDISGGFHLHIYGANEDGSEPADSRMGAQSNNRGEWYVEDRQPSVHRKGSNQFDTIGDSPKVCARIAQGAHRLVQDTSGQGTYVTGNCVPITRA